jgi:hypothetical protein
VRLLLEQNANSLPYLYAPAEAAVSTLDTVVTVCTPPGERFLDRSRLTGQGTI